MQPWQQTRVLSDYALDFSELREISFFTAAGRVIATSRVSAPTLAIPDAADVDANGMYIAPIRLDNDSLPTTTLAVRIQVKDQETAWVLGELALEELWRTINRVRIGEHGYALLLAEDQRAGRPETTHHAGPAVEGQIAPGARRARPRQHGAASGRLPFDQPERQRRLPDPRLPLDQDQTGLPT